MDPTANPVDQAAPMPPELATAPELPQKYKVKVDGSEMEVGLDDLLKGYELRQASHGRMQKASEIQKQVDQFLDTLSAGDESYLRRMVPQDKLVDIATKILRDQVEWDQMPEDRRGRIEAERERDQLKQLQERQQLEGLRAAVEQEEIRVAEQLNRDLDEAIGEWQSQNPNDPISPTVMMQIAVNMLYHEKDGQKSDARRALKRSVGTFKRDVGDYLSKLDVEGIKKHLSKEQLKGIREADLEVAMASLKSPSERQESKPKKPKAGQKQSINDYFNALEERYRR